MILKRQLAFYLTILFYFISAVQAAWRNYWKCNILQKKKI